MKGGGGVLGGWCASEGEWCVGWSSEGGGVDGVGGGVVVVVPPHYFPWNYDFPRRTNKIKFFDEISSDRLHPNDGGHHRGHPTPPHDGGCNLSLNGIGSDRLHSLSWGHHRGHLIPP